MIAGDGVECLPMRVVETFPEADMAFFLGGGSIMTVADDAVLLFAGQHVGNDLGDLLGQGCVACVDGVCAVSACIVFGMADDYCP